ncbi:FAD binding domain-containing protein [Pilobolus umbonatus]|nr:FAD binding domain-containing protein [Pilobolus umbonatus]
MKILSLFIPFIAYFVYNYIFLSNMAHQKTVVIVGGGLAGLSAAIEAHKVPNVNVIIVEKEKNIGGNSMKATSGINAIEPRDGDTRDDFIQDTLKSGAGICREELVTKLVDESREALDWLVAESEFEEGKPTLDLSVLSRCGGHSHARTHRCPSQNGRPVPVGWKLVDTLKKRFCSFSDGRVITHARVLRLLTSINSKGEKSVTGVEVIKKNPETGEETREEITADAVILTSGGFGGQTGQYIPDGTPSLLGEFAPQLLNTATTNGPWASGDGVRLGLAVGAGIRDMDQVQVHPTGFIDPNGPTDPTKFLAPEALRGHGGVLLNGEGHRFTDELTLRDIVSSHINKQLSTTHKHTNSFMGKTVPKKYAAAYLVLPQATVEDYGESTLGFYASKGFFKKVDGIDGLAELLEVDSSQLKNEFEEYDSFGSTNQPDQYGKTFYPCPLTSEKPSQYWVALVTPVVHYTMGGLEMNSNASILTGENGKAIPGLYGAGEVTGGVHGHNRLAGNSLLECVVYGRTAGRNAALYSQSEQ